MKVIFQGDVRKDVRIEPFHGSLPDEDLASSGSLEYNPAC